MADGVRTRAVLYAYGGDGEDALVECSVDSEGVLRVVQRSAGPLTQLCFDESPHEAEFELDAPAAEELARQMGVDRAEMLPAALQLRFAGPDSSLMIREDLRGRGLGYRVRERPPRALSPPAGPRGRPSERMPFVRYTALALVRVGAVRYGNTHQIGRFLNIDIPSV